MTRRIDNRLLREERGFTLSEMMVTIMVMMVVLFSLYSIFDMSVRVFSIGNDKVEAVENARLGMERMEREIRAAYPVDNANADGTFEPDAPQLFFDAVNPSTATLPVSPYDRITFGNDLNGDRRLTCAGATPCEFITYELSDAAANEPRTLQRSSSANPTDSGQPVIDFVRPDNASTADVDEGLKFTPLDRNLSPAAAEDDIRAIRIDLAILVEGSNQDGTQELTTIVTLRNRAGVAPDASSPTPTPSPTCNDGADNDGDGKVDFGADPGCSSLDDESEADAPTLPVAACLDGTDNDNDGRTDHPSDPGCSSPTDNDETDPANRPPDAVDDSAIVQQNRSVTIPVIDGANGLGRDTDLDGDTLTIASFTQPATGTVTQSGRNLVYAAENGNIARGTFTFRYTISDGRGGTDTATVTVIVS